MCFDILASLSSSYQILKLFIYFKYLSEYFRNYVRSEIPLQEQKFGFVRTTYKLSNDFNSKPLYQDLTNRVHGE